MKKKIALCLLSAFMLSLSGCSDKTAETVSETTTETVPPKTQTQRDIPILGDSDTNDECPRSPADVFVNELSEEVISQSEKIKVAADLKGMFEQKEFKGLFSVSVYGFVNEMQTSKLYNENGCYLSISSATFFDIASNQTSDVIQCFIFTKDLEEAGTVRFLNGRIETMSVSVNDSENGGTSIVLKALAKEKDKKYVFLTNGTDTILLDKENNTVSAGLSKHNLEIEGDCYSILEQKGLSVSYNEIIDEENLIWIQFE